MRIFILTSLALFNFSLLAAESLEESTLIELKTIEESSPIIPNTQETQSQKPRIRAKYYSADAIRAIPRLKTLAGRDPDHNKILFSLEGYPKNQEILFETKRLASEDPKRFETKFRFMIQEDGSIKIAGSDHTMRTFVFSSSGFLPGESVIYRFRTEDDTVSQEISGIPTPAVIRDRNHDIVLNAELVSIDPTAYRITLPTMNEGEEYKLKCTSGPGGVVKAKPKYSKNTPIHFAPASGKSKGGDALFVVERKSGELYRIQLPWGSVLQGYLHNEKVYNPQP